jgi:hypothetical protein
VISNPANTINCRASIQAGNSLQTKCHILESLQQARIAQAATVQQYQLQVTWLTPSQQISTANTQLQVVSACS